MAQRVGRGIAVLFHDRGTRRGGSGQQHAPAAFYPRERPGTHFTGGWVGLRAGLDGRKISSPPGFFFYLNPVFYIATYKQRTKRSSTSCPYHSPTYDYVRTPCKLEIRQRHASPTPHTQQDTFLGGYGLPSFETIIIHRNH